MRQRKSPAQQMRLLLVDEQTAETDYRYHYKQCDGWANYLLSRVWRLILLSIQHTVTAAISFVCVLHARRQ